MQDKLDQKIEEIVKRFKIPKEFAEASMTLKQGRNIHDKLEALNKERVLIEQGDVDAVKRHHDSGRLSARERINKLLDSGSFEELDLWHRPYETGFDIGEEMGRGDGVVVGYGLVNKHPITLWAQDATVMGGRLAP